MAIQDLDRDKATAQEALHKFRELMFSLWNLPVVEKLEKYEGTIEKSKFVRIFNLGFSWVTTWLLSMELWGESAIDTEHHDGILLIFRTPMIGGPAEYPLNLMFDMEELLSDGELDRKPSDFVRQLSTFQHIPKESYSLFLEAFALADATEEKVRGLMKRLDAMLKMLR